MEKYTRRNREKVDLMITKFASFRRLCERREKKMVKRGIDVAGAIMRLERTIRKCFELIDRDTKEVAALKDIKVDITTDFGVASANTLAQVESIYVSTRNEVERYVSVKALALIDRNELPVKVKKVGIGYYEEDIPLHGMVMQ